MMARDTLRLHFLTLFLPLAGLVIVFALMAREIQAGYGGWFPTALILAPLLAIFAALGWIVTLAWFPSYSTNATMRLKCC